MPSSKDKTLVRFPHGLPQDYARSLRSHGFGDGVQRRLLLGAYVLSHGSYDRFYVRAQKMRSRIASKLKSMLQGSDAILMPTTLGPPPDLSSIKATDEYLNDVFTTPASLAGMNRTWLSRFCRRCIILMEVLL